LISRMHRKIDVGRLQRKSVLPVDRRDMEAISLPQLQLENRPPLPEPAENIDVRAGRRSYHRNTLLLAHLIFLREFINLLLIGRRCDSIGCRAEIMLPDELPRDHEAEHEKTPQKRYGDPCQLNFLDRLIPPDAFFRRYIRHSLPLGKALFGERDRDDLHHPPQVIEQRWHGDADQQKQQRVIEQPPHEGDRLAPFANGRIGVPGRHGSPLLFENGSAALRDAYLTSVKAAWRR